MTFEEWYEWYNPDLNRLGDDCLNELISAFETGRRAGYEAGVKDTYAVFCGPIEDRP